MSFQKLNGIKKLNKTAQQQIKGGNYPPTPEDCSHIGQGRNMSTCMIMGEWSSGVCYSYSFGHLNGCN